MHKRILSFLSLLTMVLILGVVVRRRKLHRMMAAVLLHRRVLPLRNGVVALKVNGC